MEFLIVLFLKTWKIAKKAYNTPWKTAKNILKISWKIVILVS